MEIDYLTRDGKGKEFVKKVKIKEFPTVEHEFVQVQKSGLLQDVPYGTVENGGYRRIYPGEWVASS